MKDSWIDKDELDDLVAGFSPRRRAEAARQEAASQDLFEEIPSIHIPRSRPVYHNLPQANQVSPHIQPAAQVNHPIQPEPAPVVQHHPQPQQVDSGTLDSPLQVLVNRSGNIGESKISSPFAIDEDDEFDEIENQIENLASEAAKALHVLQEVRAKADKNGLIAKTGPEEPVIHVVEKIVAPAEEEPVEEETPVDEVEEEIEPEPEPEEEVVQPLDRIPLDVEIDSHLSLNGRLNALADILKEYIGMEEMMVVDQDGFSLFSTRESLTVEKSVGQFVKSIRKVYASETDARSHTASQLAIEGGKWLCVVSTDGDISGQFLMKSLLPEPLDRPELYVLVELLNEVLRPESG